MAYLIKYRRDGEKPKYISYQKEKTMEKKFQELNDDPLVVSINIYKEITYGEQANLFDARYSPF